MIQNKVFSLTQLNVLSGLKLIFKFINPGVSPDFAENHAQLFIGLLHVSLFLCPSLDDLRGGSVYVPVVVGESRINDSFSNPKAKCP